MCKIEWLLCPVCGSKTQIKQQIISFIKWTNFSCYCFFLFVILFCRRIPTFDFELYPYWNRILDNINIIPFDTVSYQLHDIVYDTGYYEYLAILNLSANIVMFIPMGVFLPLVWQKLRVFNKCIRMGILTILSVETLQLFSLLGSFDIDDLLLNLIGVCIGFLLFRGLYWLRLKRKP